MLKCHLSRIMGEKRLKISDVCTATGINRGTLSRLYHETANRVDLETIDVLCEFLGCDVGEIFEHIQSGGKSIAEDNQDSHGSL